MRDKQREMAVATRLQVRAEALARSGVVRVLAAFVGLWLVVGSALGMRHEAQVAHVLDRGTGLVVHASQLAGHHEDGRQSDIHGQADPDADHADCAVSAALHQAANPSVAFQVAASAQTRIVLDPPRIRIGFAGESVYRLAPKTSPPSA
jgi:hypothetical protein